MAFNGERRGSFSGKPLGLFDRTSAFEPENLFHLCGVIVAKRIHKGFLGMERQFAVELERGISPIWFSMPTYYDLYRATAEDAYKSFRIGESVIGIVKDDLPNFSQLRLWGLSANNNFYALKIGDAPNFLPTWHTILRVRDILEAQQFSTEHLGHVDLVASIQTIDGYYERASLKIAECNYPASASEGSLTVDEWKKHLAGCFVAGTRRHFRDEYAEDRWEYMRQLPDHFDAYCPPFQVADGTVPAPGGDLAFALFGSQKFQSSKTSTFSGQAMNLVRKAFGFSVPEKQEITRRSELADAYAIREPLPASSNVITLHK